MSFQKYFAIVSFCFLILSQNLFSQILLQGTVRDNGAEFLGSGAEPVANVLVTLTDQTDPARIYSAYTNAQGYYEIHVQDTDVNDIDIQQPRRFNLLQNYPNPFNPSTMISYEIPGPAHIRIEIFNILGQKIKTLFDGFQSNRIGQVIWDATNDFGEGVSAGVYIYSLKTEGLRISKKMLLLDGHHGNSDFTFSKKIGANESHDNVLKGQTSTLYTLRITGDHIETYERQNLELTGNTVFDATVILTVTDIDGNVYRTVKIGNQWWLAENLQTTHYNYGEEIPNVTGNSEWLSLATPGYCWYDNNINNKDIYGGLYNWYAVNTGKLAPQGWHVPTDAEWIILTDYLGGENIAGGKIKEAGFTHWVSPNTGATNSSGFFALPGGGRGDKFESLTMFANFWTSTEANINEAWRRHLTMSEQNARRDRMLKGAGFSVRCIKNDIHLEYLGQTPPGRELVPFAPNIIGNWSHAEVTVSPDGQEIYWTSRTSIYYTKLQNGSWTSPQIVPFSGQGTANYYDDVPVVSPDNRKLFFLSQRPIGYASTNREHIWYVERTATGWSAPRPLPQTVNSILGIHWQVSVANNGTLYFGASMRIFVSRLINGEYTRPEPIREINNFGDVTCPFIAPDESYVIFSKVVAGIENLYISFKDGDGQWLPPQKLNQISRTTSFVSRDGKYLFTFHHWISAEIIEELRPE